MKPVTLKVLNWDDANAFSANLSSARSQVRDALVDMLLESTPMTRTAAKRLIREVLDKQAWEIPLANPKLFETFRNRLESIGATIDRPHESA
jgi:hypothetical protein